MLSEEETKELECALGDGFQVWGHMMPGANHPLDGIIDEPFFGAKAGISNEGPATLPDFINDLRAEGYSKEEILEEYEDYLDSQVSDDAPSWRDTNPFGFSIKSIREYLVRCLCAYEGVPIEMFEPERTGYRWDAFRQFSRTWFETKILEEIELYECCMEDFARKRASSHLSLIVAFKSAGKIGRMIEHYRWRFSYGPDALRGRASILAARVGGQERAKQLGGKSKAVLSAMAVYRERGHSIQNAARLVFKDGIGTSVSANAKLWHRHSVKR